MVLVVAIGRGAEQGASVTNVLIDILLIGIVAFAASKRIGRQRAPNPAGQNSFVPRGPPKVTSVDASTPVAPTHRIETATTLPAYILHGDRAGGDGDRMAETLAIMSGPGICTPRQS